jgi:hypothetical protein
MQIGCREPDGVNVVALWCVMRQSAFRRVDMRGTLQGFALLFARVVELARGWQAAEKKTEKLEVTQALESRWLSVAPRSRQRARGGIWIVVLSTPH